MYGTHAKDGGRWERKGGKKSSMLTCSVCGERKRLGIQRDTRVGEHSQAGIRKPPPSNVGTAVAYPSGAMIQDLSPSELEELNEEVLLNEDDSIVKIPE